MSPQGRRVPLPAFQNPIIYVPPGAPTLVSSGVKVEYVAPPVAQESIWEASAAEGTGRRRDESRLDRGAGRQWNPTGKGWRPTGDWARAAADTAWQSNGENLVVPPELEAEAQEVARSWKMKMGAMQVMATKPEFGGAIWRIETEHGPRSLKRLHRPIPRSLFSVYAQVYLKEQGARVPAIIPAKDGSMAVAKDEKLWIVTDWIEGLVPANKNVIDGAAALCYGLGEFHRISQGYVPPPQAKVASRLHRWPAVYEKVRRKFDWFRQIALRYPEMPASTPLLEALPRFESQVKTMITRLANSPYASLAALGGPANGLVHQDYGYSNGQIGPGGVWLIDLDGVAYDFGIRDLRKLISSQMDDMGTWDMNWIWRMVEAYRSANKIGSELWELFLIDLALPNEFYKLCAEVVWRPEALTPELAAMIQRLLQVDQRKQEALRALGVAIK